jgi:hypothetical protein
MRAVNSSPSRTNERERTSCGPRETGAGAATSGELFAAVGAGRSVEGRGFGGVTEREGGAAGLRGSLLRGFFAGFPFVFEDWAFDGRWGFGLWEARWAWFFLFATRQPLMDRPEILPLFKS